MLLPIMISCQLEDQPQQVLQCHLETRQCSKNKTWKNIKKLLQNTKGEET